MDYGGLIRAHIDHTSTCCSMGDSKEHDLLQRLIEIEEPLISATSSISKLQQDCVQNICIIKVFVRRFFK